MKSLIGGIAKLFTGNPVIGGMLALVLLQAIGFGVVSWRLKSARADLAEARTENANERAAHGQSKANFRIASAIANAWQIAAIAAQESHWRKQVDVTETHTRDELKAALSLADLYSRRLPDRVGLRQQAKAGAGAGSESSQASAASTAPAPADPARAGGMSELDAGDVRICTVNTVKARGWQALYDSLRQPPADTPQP